jgi:hypothetical protein
VLRTSSVACKCAIDSSPLFVWGKAASASLHNYRLQVLLAQYTRPPSLTSGRF